MTHALYDPQLVALSFLIAILASYAALDLATSTRAAHGHARFSWLIGGSLAMGTGIWSMHFVGMLAFSLPGFSVGYDIPLLLLSVAVAVAASGVALGVVSHSRLSSARHALAAVAMGTAIAGMHYLGMASMGVEASITWNPVLVATSIAIALAASAGALWLAFHRRMTSEHAGLWKLAGGVVMGIAIAGMHYTGMAAAEFHPVSNGGPRPGGHVLATDGLARAVAGATLLILSITLLGSALQRRLARQRMLDDRERLRSVVDASPISIQVFGLDQRVVLWNPAAERVFGWTAAEVLGKPNPLLSEATEAEFQSMFGRAMDGETQVGVETTRLTRDGRPVDVRVSLALLRDTRGEPQGIMAMYEDVTERRTLEEQLRQSQKMEAVGLLAGGIAHDFNNLLTAISGNAELALLELDAKSTARAELEEITRSVARAARLTRQLLAFSRRQILQPSVVSLNALVGSTERMLRRVIRENVELVTLLEADTGNVLVDAGQIEQVLTNLVINARDALEGAGGRILVETRHVPSPGAFAAGPLSRPLDGPCAMLAVSDDGTGMSAETMAHMFEPFFTTKGPAHGTGLGLSMVLGTVEQSGGAIAVHSRLGTGTTVQVFFPHVAEPAAPDRQQPNVDLRGGTETILVVEDQEPVRMLARRILGRRGYTVLEAENGEEAWRMLHQAGPAVDLVLTDIVMPRMGGHELARRLEASHPELPVLFMSGYSDETTINPALAGRLVTKPFSPRELTDAVRSALDVPQGQLNASPTGDR